jgi:alternate signal-mediated exported protein
MRKGRKLLKIIHQNKLLWGLFSVVLSLLLVVGSTYSWITYSDDKINRNQPNSKHFSVAIDEVFTPNLQWSPGAVTQKKLFVKNDGQMPALVRISIYEFLAHFELDMADGTGNGGLKTVSTSSGTDMIMDDAETWAKGRTYKLEANRYYKTAEVYKGDKKNPATAYVYKGARRGDALKHLTIHFNDTDIFDQNKQPSKGKKHYWYYSDGYFYYSEVLQPKERTKDLIQQVSLDKQLPNKFKGSLYQLVPIMDAHDRTKALLDDWKISSDSYVEAMYREKVH